MPTSPLLFADLSSKGITGKWCGIWLLAVCASIVSSVSASAGPVLNSSYRGEGLPDCSDSYSFNVSIVVGAGVPDGPYSVYSINRAGNGTTHPIQITNGVPNPAGFAVALGFGSESGGYGGGPYTASIQHNTGIYATGTVVTDATVNWTDGAVRRYYPQLGPPCSDYVANVKVTFGEVTASPENTKCTDERVGGYAGVGSNADCAACKGMARYSIHSMLVSLNLVDTPLSYSPPRGPAIDFTVNYNQRESQQPATFTYSNLGPKWTFNWLSFVTDDPVTQQSRTLVSTRSGGAEVHAFQAATGDFAPDPQSHAALSRTGPASYEKHYPDGSKEIFNLSDGATVWPRRIFLTQKVDPLGNTLTIGYDSSFRVTSIADSIGQITTVSYELANDPLKITKVTDPFGRFATFEYAGGKLVKITDPVGIQSQFAYAGSGDFISSLTTPYGTTTFVSGENGTNRWIETTDPLGGKERVEYRDHAPGIFANDFPIPNASAIQNGGLDTGNTFFWDKRAMLLAPGNYTKARITHWRSDANGVISGIVSSKKEPLENRVWYGYADFSASPSQIARVLDDGTTQLYQYEYNSHGRLTKVTDPIGRSTTSLYDPNGLDLLEVRQTTGSLNQLLATYTYNSQHQPLTLTDASGQTTINTYYPSGQMHTVTNARQETTTYSYDSSGNLQSIVGALPGAVTSFTYDSFGRLRTATDSEGYTVITDYDTIDNDPTKTLNRVAKVTYPDGTYEQTTYDRLDPEWTRDRLGRWSRSFYDALRHVIATQDPLNRIITYDWCACGSLDGFSDQNGSPTTWTRDVQGRITDKTYADGTKTHFSYENATSRVAMMTDAKNQSTHYEYFLDNNVKQVSYTNAGIPTPSVSYTYDAHYNRVITMTDGTGVTTYGYNPISTTVLGAGKLASVDGPLPDDTITYAYDELGRTTGHSINGETNTSSAEYDSLGRIQSMANALGTFAYAYVNSTQRIDHIDYPNGQRVENAYFDNVGDQRLKEIKNLSPTGANISQFDYTYAAGGQIRTWTQAGGGTANSKRYDLGYDAADQLRRADLIDTGTGTPVQQYSYDYDKAGNRTNEQLGNTVATIAPNNLNQVSTRSFAVGKMHFRGHVNEPATVTVAGNLASIDAQGDFDGIANVTGGNNTVSIAATDASGNTRTNTYQVNVPYGGTIPLSYDLNGNLSSDFARTYEWDAANRLVAINYIEQPYRTEFTYDGLGRRVKIVETDNGVVTSTKNFVWKGMDIVEERDASNVVTKSYFLSGERHAGGSDDGLYYYTKDHLGSIRELSDITGAVRARYEYDPYGARVKVDGMLDADFGYTGHYYHAASNLHLTLHRAYSATLGTWLNRDPIGEIGGLNLYAYVDNAPVSYVDPLGLVKECGPFESSYEYAEPVGPKIEWREPTYFRAWTMWTMLTHRVVGPVLPNLMFIKHYKQQYNFYRAGLKRCRDTCIPGWQYEYQTELYDKRWVETWSGPMWGWGDLTTSPE
jgi:RHS repeat-associated protein